MSLAPPDEQKAGRDASASVSSQGTSPVGSPVSSPRLRAKPGLFHSLKQKIFGGQKVDDTEFEVGRRQFHQLHDALVKIQIQARNYITNLQNTIHSAHHVSDEFYALFNEGGAGAPPHAYVALIGGMNTGHDNLDSDAVLKAYVDKFNTSVLRPLTEELEHHRAIQTRMADRDQVKDDVDYYKTKTEKLQTEHDKRLSSGKDSSKDSEKLTRNVDKLNGVRSDYNELNHTLLVELHRMWNERQHTLGPIVAEFLNMERQFITMYNQAIQDIPGPDTSFFDFPRAVTPAPPLPERNHPIHKHIRAQSEGHSIANNVSPFNVTAERRTKSTFTKPSSPNGHGVALLPTHSESPPDSPRGEEGEGEEEEGANGAPTHANTNSISTSSPSPTARSSRSSRRHKSGSLSSAKHQALQQPRSSLPSPTTTTPTTTSTGKVRLQLGLPPKASPRSSSRRGVTTDPTQSNNQSPHTPPEQYTSIDPATSQASASASTPAPVPASPPKESDSLAPPAHMPDTSAPALSPPALGAQASDPTFHMHDVESSPFPTQSMALDSATTPLFSDPSEPSEDDIMTRPISSSTLDMPVTFHEPYHSHSNHNPNS